MAEQKSRSRQAGRPRTEAAFFLGACHRVVDSAVTNAIFAVIGFAIGAGSAMIVNHARSCADRGEAMNELARCAEERRAADERLIKCVGDIIRLQPAAGKDGVSRVLVWDGKTFSLEPPPSR